jgi:hypothetical protein
MPDMTPEEAERSLIGWVTVTQDRDTRARAALAVGASTHRVHQLTGIGRSTIDRILSAPTTPGCANNVPAGVPSDH